MEQMNDLRALLMHDIQMLYSAEKQIIEAMPAMIDQAQNPMLKQALEEHLVATKTHQERLDGIRQTLGIDENAVTNYSGILANLMGGTTCKGMEGIIDEGQKVMAENLSPEVMDAAIIGSNQKVEHFEIAAYGTVRSYAEQLGLMEIAALLQQTLDEEYAADKKLTSLAMTTVNQEAEMNH